MNKKHLARAHKFASFTHFGKPGGPYVQYFPHKVETSVINGNISTGPRSGYITAVIRPPSQNDYGLFEVMWEYDFAGQVEILAGNKLAFST